MDPEAGRRSFCRLCGNGCAIVVDVEDGKVVQVTGDPDDVVYQGYTCLKGRAQPAMLRHPDRLLTSMRRTADGTFEHVGSEQILDEIAGRLTAIIERYGPRAVATYWGTNAIVSSGVSVLSNAFMDAIGSPMRFTAGTLDKPGKHIAQAVHGSWMAPRQGFDRPEVALLVGMNPLVSYQGAPNGHIGKWLAESLRGGMQLIVVDPRRSDIARRATVHLQPRPGQDAAILAAMIRVILDESLLDAAFVDQHARGVNDLRRAVDPFTPSLVERLADVPADDLVRAARIFAGAARGYAAAGTGGHMAGNGTLVEYLLLDLETLCGHWLRAGERVRNPGTLVPTFSAKAQVAPPHPARGFGERLRVRGLTDTAAGLPTAALPDEILLEGNGQVRALISVSGNPVASWPDRARTVEALRSLELLVQVDPWMSQTAQLADYVIAPTMPLESAAVSQLLDFCSYHAPTYGMADAYGHVTPAIVEPPDGADLIEEWQVFRGLAARMGLDLVLDTFLWMPISPTRLEASTPLGPDELLTLLTTGSRVPIEVVRAHEGGALHPEPAVFVEPGDSTVGHRFELADGEVLADLVGLLRPPDGAGQGLPFRLICRRMAHVFNSSYNIDATNRGRFHNPAFMHPLDIADLPAVDGDLVEVRSERAAIRAVVCADPNLRRGLVSMAHGFGGVDEDDVRVNGSSVNHLLSMSEAFDPYSAQPLMTNVPVSVCPIGQLSEHE